MVPVTAEVGTVVETFGCDEIEAVEEGVTILVVVAAGEVQAGTEIIGCADMAVIFS